MHPFLILFVGMVVILGAIIGLRMNAFLALLGAAIVVSFLAPGDPTLRITRVAEAFGRTAGSVGIVIALAAIVGTAMTQSGAADRIVNGFLNLLGQKRDAIALSATAFVLSLPVFFDTVFFLLAPLARSMYARTNRNYLKYLVAMSASGIATHTLVPPHPGPLGVADTLGIDLGMMILIGIVVAIPGAVVGYLFATWIDRRMPVPLRARAGEEHALLPSESLPALVPSLIPVVMPVLLIASGTIVEALRTWVPSQAALWSSIRPVTAVIGNPVLAMLLAAGAALLLYRQQRRPTSEEMGTVVESAIMGAGVVILIVASGGAFGAMLQAAGIGPAVQQMFVGAGSERGFTFLLLAFGVTTVLKVAQGSSTVAMITAGGMVGAMVKGISLPFHTVYLGTAIAAGSLVGSWMNDAGFWVFSKIGGVTEVESLRSWSPLLAIVGFTSLVTTLLMATLLPMR
ncbi:MAG: Gluconate transporter [Gemmatimonadetes bacterium]|nr:Gluconate transporter [Gemmatimonadota bacterium]